MIPVGIVITFLTFYLPTVANAWLVPLWLGVVVIAISTVDRESKDSHDITGEARSSINRSSVG